MGKGFVNISTVIWVILAVIVGYLIVTFAIQRLGI